MKYWDYSAFDIDEITAKEPDPFKVADELKICLEEALEQIGIELSIPSRQEVTGFYPDNIRINKVAYIAIKELDLPLVSTWYKYGQYEPYESLRADTLNLGTTSNHNKVVYDHPQRGAFTRGRIISFFEEEKRDLLKTLWNYDMWEFMEFNYGRRAPHSLKDMYLANTIILKVINKLNTGDYIPITDREDFKEASMNLRYELSEISAVSPEVSKLMEEFLYALEDTLLSYDNIGEPSPDQIDFLQSAKPLYHEIVWQVPALEIAVSEVDGPQENSHAYRDRLESHIPDNVKLLESSISEWMDGMEEHDLKPNSNTFGSVSSKPEELKSLEKAVVNNNNGNQ